MERQSRQRYVGAATRMSKRAQVVNVTPRFRGVGDGERKPKSWTQQRQRESMDRWMSPEKVGYHSKWDFQALRFFQPDVT
jgi:hypothetical protein